MTVLKWYRTIFLSWFRNGIPTLSTPTEKKARNCSLLLYLPTSTPVKGTKAKDQELRRGKNYWKQQWYKKRNSSNNNINNSVQEMVIHMQKYPPRLTWQLLSNEQQWKSSPLPCFQQQESLTPAQDGWHRITAQTAYMAQGPTPCGYCQKLTLSWLKPGQFLIKVISRIFNYYQSKLKSELCPSSILTVFRMSFL